MKARTGNAKGSNPSPSSRVFGRNLRHACKARRITAPMLAVRIGASVKTAEKIFAGERKLDLDLMTQIANGIDAPLTELLRGL